MFGAPHSPGTFEKGLFCESVALVERVAGLAERRADPVRIVADLNERLGHTACIYTLDADVRARTVRFEKTIEANRSDYAIYQVQVTGHGFDKINAAMLMYHSEEDQNVGTDTISSIRMYQALIGQDKTASLYMYPYEDHGPVAIESNLDQ